MREAVIAEVSTQLSEVVGVIERHLEPTLLAVHLYGSAVDGGLKPHSDIDLLVTVTVRLDETTRRALINDLLETSASPGESEILRAVEVTIVVHDDIIPWRYPAKRELQFTVRTPDVHPVSTNEMMITPIPIGIPRVTLVPSCSGVPSQCGAKAISKIKPT